MEFLHGTVVASCQAKLTRWRPCMKGPKKLFKRSFIDRKGMPCMTRMHEDHSSVEKIGLSSDFRKGDT